MVIILDVINYCDSLCCEEFWRLKKVMFLCLVCFVYYFYLNYFNDGILKWNNNDVVKLICWF